MIKTIRFLLLPYQFSFIGGIVDGLFGGGADAAQNAAGFQQAAVNKAVKEQKAQNRRIRSDLAPYRDAGKAALPSLQDLILDPESQVDYLNNNPFFDLLKEDAFTQLTNNQATKGKLGSGGTAEALQNSFLLLGSDLLNQGINQRQNLATIGQNAAAQTGTLTTQGTANITDLLTQGGNALAAGEVGAANAKTDAANSLLSAGASIGSAFLLSDENEKEDIQEVGTLPNGLKAFLFRYKGQIQQHLGLIAQQVEKIIPEAVIEKDGKKYVNYGAALCQ